MVPRPSTSSDSYDPADLAVDEPFYDFVAALGDEEATGDGVEKNKGGDVTGGDEEGEEEEERQEEETEQEYGDKSDDHSVQSGGGGDKTKTTPVPSVKSSSSSSTSAIDGSLRSFAIMPSPFTGKEDPVQWLARFDSTLEMLGDRVPAGKRFALLRLNLQGGAYTTVQANVCPTSSTISVADDKKLYQKAKAVLIERYGEDIFKCWHTFIGRKLRPGESPAEYLTDLQRLISSARPSSISLDRTWQNAAACLMFWEGLPSDIPGLPALKSQWKSLWEARGDIVEGCLRLAKSIVVTEPETVAAVSAYQPSGKGKAKGYKGKGRYWKGKGRAGPFHLRGKAIYKNNDQQSSVRCFCCGGRGHLSRQCPSQRGDNNDSNKVIKGMLNENESRYLSVVFTSPRSDDSSSNCRDDSGDVCYGMIDTGSTVSLVSQELLRLMSVIQVDGQYRKHKLLLRSVTGQIEAYKFDNCPVLSLRGVTVKPWVLQKANILTVGSRNISAIFGMDWVASCGTLVIKSTPHSEEAIELSINDDNDRKNRERKPHAINLGIVVPQDKKSTDEVSPERNDLSIAKRRRSSSSSNIVHHDKGKELVIDQPDLIVKRKEIGPDSYRWEVQWKWQSKPESVVYKPPYYPGAIQKLSSAELELYHKSIEDMISRGYFEPVEPRDVKGWITTLPVVSLGRSTPVRVCLDYTWLNQRIESMPNSKGKPTSATEVIRTWRTYDPEHSFIVDIKHAYMQLHVIPEQQLYQCCRFVHLPEDKQTYKMTRAGFGLNVSGKALDEAVTTILDETETNKPAKKYVDDILVAEDDLEKVQSSLSKNSFNTKPPQRVAGSTLLGIHVEEDGRWTRGKSIEKELNTVPKTRSELASIVGKLVTVYPVASWLRLVAAMLTRVSAAAKPKDHPQYDYDLPNQVQELWKHVASYIKENDPCHGQWRIQPDQEWQLYTDSSSYGIAAVLCFQNQEVEDRAWLRKEGCKRHINVAETEGVLRGLELAIDYMRAYNIKSKTIHLYVDNISVKHWLTRPDERNWRHIKGICRNAIEGRLQLIEDIKLTYNISLVVHYVSSQQNKADIPSRIPKELLVQFNKVIHAVEQENEDEDIALPIQIIGARKEKSAMLKEWLKEFPIVSGKVDIPRSRAQKLLILTHNHEGRAAQFAKLKTWVNMPGLASECNNFKCSTCSSAKAFPNDRKPLVPLHSITPAPKCWDRLHIDICGPYRQLSDGTSRYYAITAIDSHSNYVSIRPSMNAPTSTNVKDFLTLIFETFHRRPLILHSDNGSQFVSKEMESALEQWNVAHIVTPINASFANGKIERWHRYLNEYLRAHNANITMTADTFMQYAKEAAHQYNITPSSRRGGVSPHEMVFRFKPSIRPEVPIECHESYNYLQSVFKSPSSRKLKPGLDVLVRVTGTVPKLQRRWVPARVVQHIGTNRVEVIKDGDKDNKPVTVHTVNLKLL